MSKTNSSTARKARGTKSGREWESLYGSASYARTADGYDEIARHLSAVLNHSLCPVELYNAIADEVTPLYERREGTTDGPEIDSPEYVARALRQRAHAARRHDA